MTTKFEKEGDTLEVTNGTGSKISSGDVVEYGALVGVALADIAVGDSGSVRFSGKFNSMPKATGSAWTAGDLLDWDTSAGKFDKGITPATGDITGCAVAAADAASGDTSGMVLLSRQAGTVN